MMFWIGFVAGGFVCGSIGLLLGCILAAGARADERMAFVLEREGAVVGRMRE